MPSFGERTPSSGFLPRSGPPPQRSENNLQKRVADRDEGENLRTGRERVEFSFRGHAQNQIGFERANPNNSITASTAPSSAHTYRRFSGSQSPPRGPRAYDKAYSPRAHDLYIPASYDSHEREPPRSVKPHKARSPLLKPAHYEEYLQRKHLPTESSGGDRDDWDELGSPYSPRGPVYRGPSRSRSRSPNSPAPISVTSTHSSRRTNSGLSKSEQERERRAAEAAEYLRAKKSPQVHPSRQSLISKTAEVSKSQEPQAVVGLSKSQAEPLKRSLAPQSSETPGGRFGVSSEKAQSPSYPTTTMGESLPLASEVPARQGGQNDSPEDQAFLFYDEISNVASLKTQMAIAENTLGKSLSEYDKAKDKIFTRFPSTSAASAKIKDTSAGAVKELKAKIANRDAVLKEISRKVPALLPGGGDSASRIDELEAQLEKKQESIAELQKTLKQTTDEFSTIQKQYNDKFASYQNVVDTLKKDYLTLNSSQEASDKRVARLEQDIPPNLKQIIQKLGPLSTRMDVSDNTHRELRKFYEESRNTNMRAVNAQTSSISTIQEKIEVLTMERAGVDHRLKKLEDLDLASTNANSQIKISSLDERLKEAEARITSSLSPLAPFQALEQKTAAIDAKVEQINTKIEQNHRDARNLAVTNTRDREHPTDLIETRLAALESQPWLDSFRHEKDSFRRDIMHDVEQLQNGTIELMGGLIQALQTGLSNIQTRVSLLETSGTSAKNDISQANHRISALEDSSNSASSNLSEAKERLVVLENQPGFSAKGVDALQGLIELHQVDIQQLQQDLKDTREAIPGVTAPGVTALQVIETIRNQPHMLPYAFNTNLLASCPKRLDEIVTQVEQISSRVGEVSTRIDAVDFKTDHLDQRMGSINTKEQAQYIVSQIAEQYPSLRNAIDTIVLKLEVEALSKRISTTEEAQSKASFLDGGSLAYAPLRKDVDELSKKFIELKNTTLELKWTTQNDKKEVEQSQSDIASEFARVQVEVEAVASSSAILKNEMNARLQAIKDGQVESAVNIESQMVDIGSQVENMGNNQEKSEVEIKNIKNSQKRTDKEIEAIKNGQKKSEQEIESIKGQISRVSISSPFDNKDGFGPRSVPKPSIFQTSTPRQHSVQSDASNKKKRTKNGSANTNGGTSRKKRKIGEPDAPMVEISDSD